jgi:glycosyltransferase involved in cell wall biosynthesis
MESILSQDGVSLEFIIIDDGSTDARHTLSLERDIS